MPSCAASLSTFRQMRRSRAFGPFARVTAFSSTNGIQEIDGSDFGRITIVGVCSLTNRGPTSVFSRGVQSRPETRAERGRMRRRQPLPGPPGD